MARSARNAHSTVGEQGLSSAAGQTPVAFLGFEVLRNWMSRALQSAQNSAGWLQELQRQNQQAATIWAETLALGVLNAQQAQGIDDLLAVPAKMLSRQIESESRRFGENLQNMLESELRWMGEWHEHALHGARGLAAGPLPDGTGANGQLSPWAAWSQGLEAWQGAVRSLAGGEGRATAA